MKVTVTLPKKFRRATDEAVRRALYSLAVVARDRVTQLAQARLGGSAALFVNSVVGPTFEENSFTLRLGSRLASMMEAGSPPYDLKVMLRGRPFVNVPFRQGTPGSTVLPPMPQADYNVMRSMAKKAGNAARVRAPKHMPSQPETKRTPKGAYTWSAGKTSGMLRLSKTYRGATQSQYMTFRRISAKSKPESWIHPGFKPLGVFPRVATEMRKLAPRVLADAMRGK
jgi:hypothetical protein